jgi:hypothetical protein
MAQVQIERKYKQSASSCYEALLNGLPKAGFTIWKTREIAYLILANRQEDGKVISASVMISGFSPASLTLTLSGDDFGEDQLKQYSEKILEVVENIIPN